MQGRGSALSGPLAASLFVLALVGLPILVPGYDAVRQTVSEIGEVGSPARAPFALALLLVSACILVFASALRKAARGLGRTTLPAWVAACCAISVAGVGVFAYPHPLHNVFGLSELVGYQAPLVLALSWRDTPRAGPLVRFSAVMAAVVWAAILINLVPLFRPPALWPHVKPMFGLVQRSLFSAWFLWCAGAGLLLRRI